MRCLARAYASSHPALTIWVNSLDQPVAIPVHIYEEPETVPVRLLTLVHLSTKFEASILGLYGIRRGYDQIILPD